MIESLDPGGEHGDGDGEPVGERGADREGAAAGDRGDRADGAHGASPAAAEDTGGGSRALVRRADSAPADGASANGAPLPQPRVTPAMRAALTVGAVVFALGALVKLVAAAWLSIAAGITVVAASILVRTGGLETTTFETCVIAALTLDALLLLDIAAAVIARRANPKAAVGWTGAYRRHPMALTSAGLLSALTLLAAIGWRRPAAFPHQLVTMATLASAYYFMLLALLYTGRAVNRIWVPLRAWGHSTPYRTGFLTATLLLLGIVGFALPRLDAAQRPLVRAADRLEALRPPALEITGAASAQLAGLCIAAGAVAPELAASARAPACGLAGDASDAAPGDAVAR